MSSAFQIKFLCTHLSNDGRGLGFGIFNAMYVLWRWSSSFSIIESTSESILCKLVDAQNFLYNLVNIPLNSNSCIQYDYPLTHRPLHREHWNLLYASDLHLLWLRGNIPSHTHNTLIIQSPKLDRVLSNPSPMNCNRTIDNDGISCLVFEKVKLGETMVEFGRF